MISKLTEQLEKLALHTNPANALKILGKIPPGVFEQIQLMRFRQTLKLAAKAPFYCEQFQKRGIDAGKIKHPAQLGDFFTTGEDLRKYGAEAFVTGRAETAFETTGTTSNETKRVFFLESRTQRNGQSERNRFV